MFDAYLAVPYTDKNPEVCQMRHDAITEIYDALTLSGFAVISPITTSHRLAPKMGSDWSAWAAIDEKALSACRCMVIYCMPGWHVSEGIANEIRLCNAMGKPIHLLPYGVGLDLAMSILRRTFDTAS